MIEVSNLTKSFYNKASRKKEDVVSNVSFFCNPGKLTVLLGENGSGKSTIIKCLCGIHYPTSGKVLFHTPDGFTYDSETESNIIKSFAGYVPEIPVLPENMKVKDFLTYAEKLFNSSLKEKIIEQNQLENVLEKRIATLSKGYKQRLSLSYALIKDPDFLILDEPITGLDPKQIIEMRKLIMKLAETKTVLLSTHILSEVHEMDCNINILSKGKIIETGDETSILKKSGCNSIEEAFIKMIR